MIVNFEYEIGDSVLIKTIGTIGQIESLSFNNINGKMFRVIYWNAGQRYSVWMYDWEINKS
jgi:hypothetical protein